MVSFAHRCRVSASDVGLSSWCWCRSGEVAALVIDAPFADYYTSSNCDLFEVRALWCNLGMLQGRRVWWQPCRHCDCCCRWARW